DHRAVIRDLVGVERAAVAPRAAVGRAAAGRVDVGGRGPGQNVIEARGLAAVIAIPERAARERLGRPGQAGAGGDRGDVGAIAVVGRVEVAEHDDAIARVLGAGAADQAPEPGELAGADVAVVAAGLEM